MHKVQQLVKISRSIFELKDVAGIRMGDHIPFIILGIHKPAEIQERPGGKKAEEKKGEAPASGKLYPMGHLGPEYPEIGKSPEEKNRSHQGQEHEKDNPYGRP